MSASMRFLLASDDPWPLAAEGQPVAPGDARLLDWAQWLAVRDQWPEGVRAGVAIGNDIDLRDVLPDLPRLAGIALRFPKWTDGRAYSQARLLRTRHRFSGELRAIGDVIADMAAQLHRTGFDTAVLRPGESIAVATRMLGLIPAFYQADAQQRRMRFARDAAGAVLS